MTNIVLDAGTTWSKIVERTTSSLMANYIIFPFVSLSSPFCIPLGFLLCFSKCHVLFAFGSSFTHKIILGHCCSSRRSADCPAIRRIPQPLRWYRWGALHFGKP